MESFETEAVVIGAGVVGIAVARALSRAGLETVVLEREATFGTETSSRNSEVIHAGIYYPANSLMAQCCVKGRHALYAFCDSHGVAYRRFGKLIVATDDQEAQRLASIRDGAARNGVDDLELIDGARARSLEPALHATAAILSPSTGVVDSHGFMLALLGDAEDAGCSFAFQSPVASICRTAQNLVVEVGGGQPARLTARIVVNAAGLWAPALARQTEGLAAEHIPTPYYAKGNYFSLKGRSPFGRLIYPVPVAGGLGTHLTLDLAGEARFGPDVEWVDGLNYDVDPRRGQSFYAAIRRYWPALPDDALQPAYAGIRPKIVPPEVAKQDFMLQTWTTHGIPGLVNLFGIESPGLTASLALADRVAEAVLQ